MPHTYGVEDRVQVRIRHLVWIEAVVVWVGLVGLSVRLPAGTLLYRDFCEVAPEGSEF